MSPIREQHYFIRPVLENRLKEFTINPESRGRGIFGDYETYCDFWKASFGDRFLDMATMIRLGTAIESGLRDYYVRRTGGASHATGDLARGVFQRLLDRPGMEGAVSHYRSDLGYELPANEHYRAVGEVMAHRHLYAHRSGLVDDNYITQWKRLSGEDIRPELVAQGYPHQDVYWWRPLNNLTEYIQAVDDFFKAFPEP